MGTGDAAHRFPKYRWIGGEVDTATRQIHDQSHRRRRTSQQCDFRVPTEAVSTKRFEVSRRSECLVWGHRKTSFDVLPNRRRKNLTLASPSPCAHRSSAWPILICGRVMKCALSTLGASIIEAAVGLHVMVLAKRKIHLRRFVIARQPSEPQRGMPSIEPATFGRLNCRDGQAAAFSWARSSVFRASTILAERVGFEPTVGSHLRQFSRLLP